MKYEDKISRFFTWDIHYSCNYYCVYCFFAHKWQEMAKVNTYPGLDKWIDAWKSVFDRYGSCNIHITGGEPFSYPGIMDLCAALEKMHKLSFDTNLSFDPGELLAKLQHPERTGFSAAFHPDHAQIDVFIDKLSVLRSAGCRIGGMNFVAYPPNLERISDYARAASKAGFNITVMPFRGVYEGKEYPAAYTDRQKHLIRTLGQEEYDEKSEKACSDDNKHEPGEKVSDQMLEWYSKDGSREGMLCMMGQVYSKVHPDGNAHRCCMTWKNWGLLGNLLEGTFEFYDDPMPCLWAKCSCSSAMIVGEEKRWEEHWKGRRGE